MISIQPENLTLAGLIVFTILLVVMCYRHIWYKNRRDEGTVEEWFFLRGLITIPSGIILGVLWGRQYGVEIAGLLALTIFTFTFVAMIQSAVHNHKLVIRKDTNIPISIGGAMSIPMLFFVASMLIAGLVYHPVNACVDNRCLEGLVL